MTETKSDFNENVENKEPAADQAKQDELATKEWYWSKISRAQANDLMHGKKDGTFLVRISSTANHDYTLTVKKDGVNKMMRILCKNGKYGFGELCRFDSLQSLIEYHQKNSLAEYYPEMNIKLEYPLSNADICSSLNVGSNKGNVEALVEKFEQENQLCLNLTQQYDDCHEAYKRCQDEIQKFKQNLSCFEETFAIFEEQIKLNEENQKEAMAHEKAGLAKHRFDIEEKLLEIKQFRKELEEQCEAKNLESASLDRQINELKPLLNEKRRITEQIKAILVHKFGKKDVEKMFKSPSNPNVAPLTAITPFGKQREPSFNESHYDPAQGKSLNYCLIDIANSSNSGSYSPVNSPSSPTNPDRFPDTAKPSGSSGFPSNGPPTTLNDSSIRNLHISSSSSPANVQGSPLNQQSRGSTVNPPPAPLTPEDPATYLDLDALKTSASALTIDAPWYFGSTSKEDVFTIMRDKPDGAFLVRDSPNKPEAPFTLTVRVNGSTKLLRIVQNKGHLYGFRSDELFGSVVELIEHHRTEPLVVKNPDLKIRLTQAVTRDQARSLLPTIS